MHKNKITTVELLTGYRFDVNVQAHKNVRVILYLTYFVETSANSGVVVDMKQWFVYWRISLCTPK